MFTALTFCIGVPLVLAGIVIVAVLEMAARDEGDVWTYNGVPEPESKINATDKETLI